MIKAQNDKDRAGTQPDVTQAFPARRDARPAARRAGAGREVLMLQRTQSAAFLGGAYVFPGGALDTAGCRSARSSA